MIKILNISNMDDTFTNQELSIKQFNNLIGVLKVIRGVYTIRYVEKAHERVIQV